MSSFNKLSTSPSLIAALNELLQSFVLSKFYSARPDIAFEKLRKAGWLCSALAESDDENHKKQAQAFAILLHLHGGGEEMYDKLSYVILSRLGNLLSTKFLDSLFSVEGAQRSTRGLRYEFGQLLNIELSKERADRIIQLGQDSILTTDFQLDLWRKLYSADNIAISAPTSAGKSFIIQNYIQQYYATNLSAQGLYIVPTKALINQASDDLRKVLKGVTIRTSFIEDESIANAEGDSIYYAIPTGSVIYILTPERCLRLLQNLVKSKFYPNIVFVDEIQNIEDTQGRGMLFEFVLESIATSFPESKIITAGPFINNEKAVFEEIFNLKANSCSTGLSPVFQLQTIVRNTTSENKLELFINNSPSDDKIKVSINVDFSFVRELGLNKGTGLAKTIKAILGNSKQQSIVYCPKTNLAEIWALKLEEHMPYPDNITEEVRELIDFIASEIHPLYFLIRCLRKNIAFHHSKLPDIVRKEVEDLFKQGDLSILYCTTTLLQGVNLPAHNMFITSPLKRTTELSPFEFGNLIGRAGRIKDSLYGIIYCIEDNDEKKQWAEAFYNSTFQKDVIPATRKVLQNPSEVLQNIDKTSIEIRDGRVATTIITLRHHFVSSPGSFGKYLAGKKLNQEDILKIINPIVSSLEFITIPKEALSLNPNIDPLLQNSLYEAIKREGISQWVINHSGGNFYKKIKKENTDLYKYEELSFYWQFTKLCEKLNELFDLRSEAYFKLDIPLSIRPMAYFGYRWLTNISLKEIISDDIKYNAETRKIIDANNENDVNSRINAVINIHSKIATFLLPKYFKLLADILKFILNEEEASIYKFTLSLPLMLELGTTEPYIIQLISAGITRSVAIQIFNEFKKVRDYKSIDILIWIQDRNNISSINKIFIRYLIKLGFTKN